MFPVAGVVVALTGKLRFGGPQASDTILRKEHTTAHPCHIPGAQTHNSTLAVFKFSMLGDEISNCVMVPSMD